MITKDCQLCGTSFKAQACYEKRGPNRVKFCSKICAAKFRANASLSSLKNRGLGRGINPAFLKSNCKLYSVWASMIERCNAEGSAYYKFYGARGIGVCDRWRDYIEFASWAQESGYALGLTLERLDNNQGYSPENCSWATRATQARNTRRNVLTIEKVKEIRQAYINGHRIKDIATLFQTSATQIACVVHNKTWKNV